ncbi:MAG: protein-export chaperone SecB [Bacteroidia bacterium]
MSEETIPQISLRDILLVESEFKKLGDKGKWPQQHTLINIELRASESEDITICELTITLTPSDEGEQVYYAKVKMEAAFILPAELPFDREQFKYINGPAIIYPYIREHISAVTGKAGIGPIFLAPFNFVQHYKTHIQGKITSD